MQSRLKHIIFTLCIIFLSYMSHARSIYLIDKYSHYVYKCNADATGCFPQSGSHIRPNSIAISPTARYLVISSELNKLYLCILKPDEVKLKCSQDNYNLSDPQGMAYSPIDESMSNYLYVTNKGNGSVDVCEIKEITPYQQYRIMCKKAGTGFTAPNNIAISPNGRYAYITQPNTSSVEVCHILPDFTFSNCTNYTQRYVYPKPVAVAVDKPGKFLYILDGALIHNGISCPLYHNGSSIGACHGYQVAVDSAATDIEMPKEYYIESANDAFAYISSQNKLYFCIIPNGIYNCHPIDSKSFNYISSLSFTYK